jgi:hypothetical protein
MSTFQSLRVSFSTYSGLRLTNPDASTVDGFYFDGIAGLAQHGLEINSGLGLSLRNILHYAYSGSYTPASGSSFIFLNRCSGITLQGLHIERMLDMNATIDAFGCNGVEISGIYSVFDGNTFLLNRNSNGIKLQHWLSWEVRQPGMYDIDIQGGTANNVDVNWEKCYFWPYPATFTYRAILVNNAAGQSSDATAGLPAPYAYKTLIDADQTLTSQGAYQLPIITANRSLVLPQPSGPGQFLYLLNRNTSPQFAWNISGSVLLRDAEGNTLTSVPYQSSLFAISDNQVTSGWRIVGFVTPVSVRGAQRVAYQARSASPGVYNITDDDAVLDFDSTAGTWNPVLPDATTRKGWSFTIKKTDSSANPVQITTTSGQTIDGIATRYLTRKNQWVLVISSGINWRIISASATVREQLLLDSTGLVSQNFDRATGSQAFSMGTQIVRYALIPFLEGDVVTNICFRVELAAATTLLKVALFDKSANQLGVSADAHATSSALGDHAVALGSPYTIPLTGCYYVALLMVGSGTLASVLAGRTMPTAYGGFGSGITPAGSQSGQSDMPSPGAITASSTEIWLGVS